MKNNSLLTSDQQKSIRQSDLLSAITSIGSESEATNRLLMKMTPGAINRLNQSRKAYRYGLHASAPSICMGPDKCSFFQVCPFGYGFEIDEAGTRKPVFDSIDNFPIGSACLMEVNLIEDKLISYINEFDIDPDSASELSLVNDLALIDLYKNRCVLFLSAGDRQSEGTDFLKVDLSFDPKHGTEIGRSYKEHPVLSIIERLEKRRFKILEELLATRRGKMTLASKLKKADDSSKMLNEIQKIREVVTNQKILANEESVIDAEVLEID